MRGSVAGSISVLLVLSLIGPSVAGIVPSVAPTEAVLPTADDIPEAGTPDDPYAWTQGLSLGQLATAARQHAGPAMDGYLPAPDTFAGYAAASDDERRQGWRSWLLATDLVKAATPGDLEIPASWQDEDVSPMSTQAPVHDDLGTPRGVRGLWSLEAHGTPREIVSLDDNGAHALITSRGAIRFEAPGADPTWMVKPGASIGNVHTTDADGDGVQDIAMMNYAWYSVDAPSFVLISGASGGVLFQGFAGDERLLTWTLTDSDGDGDQDILGITRAEKLIAAELDGTVLWTADLLELPSLYENGLLFYIYMAYDRLGWSMYGDANADGVQDAFVGSMYRGVAYAFPVLFHRVDTQYASAYSGTDGARLWTMPLPPIGNPTFYATTSTGDLDGDGSDDILLRGLSFFFDPVPLASVYIVSSMNLVLSGADGTTLVRDSYDYVVACAVLVCQIVPLSNNLYSGYGFVDLNADGKEELLGITYTSSPGGAELTLTARGMGSVPGGPSNELYTVGLGGASDMTGIVSSTLVASGTDAPPALWMLIFQADYTENFENIQDINTRIVRVTPDGAAGQSTARLLGAWDIDPATGQTYGWIVDDDIWAPVDAEGRNIGPGLRLILSHTPSLITDHNGDGVPDLLLRKSVGFRWADGRSGGLLGDVKRPVTTTTGMLVKDDGRDRFLEYDMTSGDHVLVDLKTQEEVWVLTDADLDDHWVGWLEDLTGDGRVDAALLDMWWYGEDNTLRIVSPADGTDVAEYSMQNRNFQVADVLTSRAGHELLVTQTDPETYEEDLQLLVPGEEEERWSVALGDGYVRLAEHGYLIVTDWGSGTVIELLDGATGEKVYEHPLPADSYVSGIEFTFVDADKTPDIVLSYVLDEEGSEYATHNVTLIDWSRDRVLSSFELVKDDGDSGYVTLMGMSPMGGTMVIYLYDYSSSYLTAEVGDWDGDGLVDFAYSEARWPTVRSSATGEILALGPSKGSFGYPTDLDGDKRNEVALISDTGRLRYFAYNAPAVLDAEPDVLHIDAPHAPQVEDEAFFEKEEAPALPLVFVMVLLALLGAALRRRP